MRDIHEIPSLSDCHHIEAQKRITKYKVGVLSFRFNNYFGSEMHKSSIVMLSCLLEVGADENREMVLVARVGVAWCGVGPIKSPG